MVLIFYTVRRKLPLRQKQRGAVASNILGRGIEVQSRAEIAATGPILSPGRGASTVRRRGSFRHKANLQPFALDLRILAVVDHVHGRRGEGRSC
jgi:hypothetical protein